MGAGGNLLEGLPVADRGLLVGGVVRRGRVRTGRDGALLGVERLLALGAADGLQPAFRALGVLGALRQHERVGQDRKSTRLNSSHMSISYAVFCLKKKN